MSAKVYALEDRKFVGKRCWVEMVACIPEGLGGGRVHRLAEVEVEFIPLRKNPSFRVDFVEGGSMFIPQEKYGESYVFWDGEPDELYFKDE